MESKQPRMARLSSTGNALSFWRFLTCETLQVAMFANIECWLGFLEMYVNVLASYLSKSANIWHFVHARIIIFNCRGKIYQLANVLIRGFDHHKLHSPGYPTIIDMNLYNPSNLPYFQCVRNR